MSSNARTYTIDDLLFLMDRLRDPVAGCPWDLKQSYRSIVPSTLEEAYEVADAIERGDYAHLREELGDLLFQAVFYSRLAKEDQLFEFQDVVDSLVSKLIRRHPHVFPQGHLNSDTSPNDTSEKEVKQNWEQLKRQERHTKGMIGLLADIPLALPALSRAAKLQKRAAQVGFDWPDAAGVMEKIGEELGELERATAAGVQAEVEEELGDLLFTCVNLSRHLKVDAEAALRRANAKFTARFQIMEKVAADENLRLEDQSSAKLEEWWRRAKSQSG